MYLPLGHHPLRAVPRFSAGLLNLAFRIILGSKKKMAKMESFLRFLRSLIPYFLAKQERCCAAAAAVLPRAACGEEPSLRLAAAPAPSQPAAGTTQARNRLRWGCSRASRAPMRLLGRASRAHAGVEKDVQACCRFGDLGDGPCFLMKRELEMNIGTMARGFLIWNHPTVSKRRCSSMCAVGVVCVCVFLECGAG